MKPLRFFLATLCLTVAAFATVNFFYQNDVEVKVQAIKKESYKPHISVTGTIQKVNSSSAASSVAAAAMGGQSGTVVTALIGESSISNVKVGQKALVTGVGFKDKYYDATVIKIGDKAQKVTSLNSKNVVVEVYLKIDSPDNALKTGFTAKADIFTGEEAFKTLVPYGAVLQDGMGEYVYVNENDTAQKRYIQTGLELENGYEVLSGLNEGEVVIITPGQISSNGQTIKTVGKAGE